MRLALLSDVHANHMAFSRAIALAERAGAEGFVLMGDYVSDFPAPQKTMDLVRSLQKMYPTWLIRGNRDEYMLDHRAGKSPGWREGSANGSFLYTYENLREEDFALLSGLPPCRTVRIGGHAPFEVCYVSPFLTREMIIDHDARITECLDAVSARRLFLGHTHRIRTYRANGKAAFFVGSVGLPDGFGGMTQFALIDDRSGNWEIEHIIAEYDVERMIAEFESSGLSARANMWAVAVRAMALTGKNMPSLLHHTALALFGSAGGIAPEALYEQAARQIGLI